MFELYINVDPSYEVKSLCSWASEGGEGEQRGAATPLWKSFTNHFLLPFESYKTIIFCHERGHLVRHLLVTVCALALRLRNEYTKYSVYKDSPNPHKHIHLKIPADAPGRGQLNTPMKGKTSLF